MGAIKPVLRGFRAAARAYFLRVDGSVESPMAPMFDPVWEYNNMPAAQRRFGGAPPRAPAVSKRGAMITGDREVVRPGDGPAGPRDSEQHRVCRWL